MSIFVITKGVYDHACLFICDHKLVRGMVFCDHITTIDDISVEKCSNNSNLLRFYIVIIIINIYA